MQTRNHFLRSLPLTAASLGNKLGVRVVVGGTDCCTDGNVIRLPAMSSEISEDEMLGYVMHEAAHIRLTNFEVNRFADSQAPAVRAVLINALEDVRIENEFERLYDGARMILDGCREICVKRIEGNLEPFESNPAGTLGLYSLCHGHAVWTRLDYMEPLHVRVGALMEQHFGADIRHQIDTILSSLPKTRNTGGVAVLVDRILDLLKNKAGVSDSTQSGDQRFKPENPAQSGGNLVYSESRRDGTDAKEASGSVSSANPLDGKPSGEGQNGGGSNARKGAQACLHALRADEGAFDHSLDVSFLYGEKIAKENEKSEKDGNAFGSIRDPDLDLSEIVRKVQCSGTEESDSADERSRKEKRGRVRLRETMEASSGVRRALKALVQTESRCGIRTAREGRRISTTAAARLAVWNTRIFEKSREVKAVDTALHVLLDLSGSMSKDVRTATTAALTITAALMGIPHVNPALSTFNGNDCFRPIIPHGSTSPAPYAERIGAMQAIGGTPLHKALLGAGIALARTREAKKVVLVVTDGYPNNLNTTAAIARQLRASGMRLYGLGVGTDFPLNIKEHFDVLARIRSADDLEAALLDIGTQIALEANGAGRV